MSLTQRPFCEQGKDNVALSFFLLLAHVTRQIAKASGCKPKVACLGPDLKCSQTTKDQRQMGTAKTPTDFGTGWFGSGRGASGATCCSKGAKQLDEGKQIGISITSSSGLCV